jgi:hypothetical protein
MRKIKAALKQPATWIALVVGGIAALSFGFISNILNPVASKVKDVLPKS